MRLSQREKNNSKMRLLKSLHIVISFLIFLLIYITYYHSGLSPEYHMKADWIVCVTYIIFQIIFMRTFDAHLVGYVTIFDLVYSQSLAVLFSGIIAYAMICLVYMALVKPGMLFVALCLQMLWNVVWSYMTNRLYFHINKSRATALIYRNSNDLARLSEIRMFEKKFAIMKHIENPQSFIEIESQLDGIECICVAGVDASLRNGLAKYCIEHNVFGYFAPHVGDILMNGARHMRNFSVPILCVKSALPNPEYLFIKRAFDVLISLIAIILLSPLMLLIAGIIKVSDGGPALYKQVRLTKDRRAFNILKFRSMRVDAEKDGKARLASENDDRITPIGRIIRAIRFDELPQLINILKGDMSVVGPRPERPEIAKQYEQTLPAFSLRLQVKAGLTGFAQVYGKYNTTPYDKLQFDLMYINRMSIIEDLKIMFNTFKILFRKESTEGIAEGQTTAMAETTKTGIVTASDTNQSES